MIVFMLPDLQIGSSSIHLWCEVNAATKHVLVRGGEGLSSTLEEMIPLNVNCIRKTLFYSKSKTLLHWNVDRIEIYVKVCVFTAKHFWWTTKMFSIIDLKLFYFCVGYVWPFILAKNFQQKSSGGLFAVNIWYWIRRCWFEGYLQFMVL